MSLGHGAARGAAWNLATVLIERSVGMAVLAILLRHVTIADVGIVAIASAISEIGRMITSGGAGEQVIASPGDRSVEAGAFWAQIILAIAFTIALFALAPALARWYGDPALGWVTRALAANIFIGAFLIVPSARLAQVMRFRALSLMSLGSTLLGGTIALALVFAGYDLPALIAQRIVGISFYAVAASIVARWHPPIPPGFAGIGAALRFNLPMMAAGFVDYIANTGYVVLVGARLPIVAVGQFRIAQRLAEVLQELAIFPTSKVFLPVFVAVRDDPDRRFAIAKKLCDALAILSLGVAAVAGAAATPITILLFGHRWAAAGPVFGAMSLIVPAAALYAFVNPMLTALKRPGLVSLFAALNAATIACAAWFAAPFGLMALAWTLAARGALAAGLLLPAFSIGLGRSAKPIFSLLITPLFGLLIARLAGEIVTRTIPASTDPFTALIFAGGAAGVAFSATLLVFARRRTLALIATLLRLFRPAPTSTAL